MEILFLSPLQAWGIGNRSSFCSFSLSFLFFHNNWKQRFVAVFRPSGVLNLWTVVSS